MKRLFVCASLVLVSACGGDSPASNATRPHLEGRLDEAGQEARFVACQDRYSHYRSLGVWKNGGVSPGVDRGAWDQLTDAEKSEVFEISACIDSVGQIEEKMVTVSEDGNGPEIETRRISNTRDFAGEVPE